ncbi:hypothetical protein DOM22_11585 [Bdellovibrio sp. ZAP7]|uniref:hypothetical protein n=1 Tax=Bdellovibrio sp. ZAP7 TaxID=2231053 RepID=UPI00115A8A15|nr:hypothetical protein [Bdellovibrio sp. ZAP7]QDK45740.1 hypothetical protein DOM22_11585 [Bdellovibrio sp. ZAP7]
MKKMLVFIVTNLVARSVFAAPAPVEPLKMISSDKGVAVYADTCSNGANSTDGETVREFIKNMEADKNSKLYKIEQKAAQERKAEVYVWVSEPTLAAHVRMGCGESYNKQIAMVNTQEKAYNGHNMRTSYIIVIKDTVEGGVRTLELVDVKPFSLKSDNE